MILSIESFGYYERVVNDSGMGSRCPRSNDSSDIAAIRLGKAAQQRSAMIASITLFALVRKFTYCNVLSHTKERDIFRLT